MLGPEYVSCYLIPICVLLPQHAGTAGLRPSTPVQGAYRRTRWYRGLVAEHAAEGRRNADAAADVAPQPRRRPRRRQQRRLPAAAAPRRPAGPVRVPRQPVRGAATSRRPPSRHYRRRRRRRRRHCSHRHRRRHCCRRRRPAAVVVAVASRRQSRVSDAESGLCARTTQRHALSRQLEKGAPGVACLADTQTAPQLGYASMRVP